MNMLNPAEVFHASTAGDSLVVAKQRSRSHEWLRGKFGEIAQRVPRHFEFGDFIDPSSGGISQRRRAVLNRDTGLPVAAVSDRYKLLPHGEIIDAVAEAKIDGMETDQLPAEFYIGDSGERIGFRVILPEIKFDPGDGNPLLGRLEGFNSVDGSMPFRLALGLFRLVCGNGQAWGLGRNLIRMHTAGIGRVDIGEFIRKGLEDMPRVAENYRTWFRQSVSAEQWGRASEVIEKVFDSGKANRIKAIWESGEDPSIQGVGRVVPGLPRERTVFRAYQSMTWIASRTRDLQAQVRQHKLAETVMSVAFN
jgi:hypothetical protein